MAVDLGGRVICVTGAARGIGEAICARLRAAGATVIATDILFNGSFSSGGDQFHHDVTSEDDWRELARVIEERHGTLSGLVNNAGIDYTGTLEETSLESWRKIQAVNVESVFIGTKAMLPLLRTASSSLDGGSTIVNMSSVGGLRGYAYAVPYTASKAAVAMITRSTALEFAALGYDIRVNSVHPGSVETGMMDRIYETRAAIKAVSAEETRQQSAARHPVGRLGRPDEVAEVVAFLCSADSAFMFGSEMVIDGGFTAK